MLTCNAIIPDTFELLSSVENIHQHGNNTCACHKIGGEEHNAQQLYILYIHILGKHTLAQQILCWPSYSSEQGSSQPSRHSLHAGLHEGRCSLLCAQQQLHLPTKCYIASGHQQ